MYLYFIVYIYIYTYMLNRYETQGARKTNIGHRVVAKKNVFV